MCVCVRVCKKDLVISSKFCDKSCLTEPVLITSLWPNVSCLKRPRQNIYCSTVRSETFGEPVNGQCLHYTCCGWPGRSSVHDHNLAHTCTHTLIYMYTHIQVQAHTHTHTLSPSLSIVNMVFWYRIEVLFWTVGPRAGCKKALIIAYSITLSDKKKFIRRTQCPTTTLVLQTQAAHRLQSKWMNSKTHMHAPTHTHACTRTHARMHARTHVHTHTHTHTEKKQLYLGPSKTGCPLRVKSTWGKGLPSTRHSSLMLVPSTSRTSCSFWTKEGGMWAGGGAGAGAVGGGAWGRGGAYSGWGALSGANCSKGMGLAETQTDGLLKRQSFLF